MATCSALYPLQAAGAGGSGKSTLVTHLYKQGWSYLSDDVIALDLTTGKILPFPQTPRVRQNSGKLVPSDRLAEVPKLEVILECDRIYREAMTIGAIVFVKYSPGTLAQISPCSPATAALELLRNCINFVDHKQAAMHRVSELVKQVQVFCLSFSDEKTVPTAGNLGIPNTQHSALSRGGADNNSIDV
ncbi:hypothetical protein LC593_28360 [Nostoc sp. CHAB 5844]|nr:hypothetical protein [Nostoc sp. CHAB 5844]